MDLSKKYRIEKLQPQDVEESARLLTKTFSPNPVYKQIFRNPKHATSGLYHMFRAELMLQNDQTTFSKVVKSTKNNQIVGLCTLLPPKRPNNRLITYTKLKPVLIIRKFGLPPLWRMRKLDHANHAALDHAMKQKKYNYLAALAVSKELQGEGIGSFLLHDCLDNFSKQKTGSNTIALTTQLPENVTFYQKAGFKKIEESTVTAGNMSYYNYCMKIKL